LLLAASLLITALAGYALWFSHERSLEKAVTASESMADMIESRFDATLRRAQSVLEFSTTLPADALQARHAPKFKASIEKDLVMLTSNFPEVLDFTVFDAAGELLYASQAVPGISSLKTLPYFQQIRQQPDAGLLFPDVMPGTRKRQALLLEVLPLRNAAGQLLGVAQATIDLRHFQQRLVKQDIGPNGLIAIRRSDDSRLVLRYPDAPDELNQPAVSPLTRHIQAGNQSISMRFTSPADSISRVYSARALDHYPFYIGVALADEDALDGWREEAGITLSLVALLLVVAWWYFFRIARAERARLQLLAERAAEARTTRERAQQTQAILDNVADGIITIDEFGMVRSFNKAAEHIFGYAEADVIGRNVSLLMPEPHRSAHDGYLMHYRQTGEARVIGQGREVEGLRHDGSTFPMDLAVSRSEHDGRPLFIGLVRDITERKRVERMKSEFVSTVSHELRTPLTSISGALGLVCGGALGPMPEKAMSMLTIAQKNSLQLTHLINDLLDMEKLVAGKMSFDLQWQDIMPLVEQSMESTQAYAEKYQVQQIVTARTEGVEVRVDAHRLQQVLRNFLSNAAKFSPPGAQVEVAVRQRPGAVRVEVTDHGPGIPEEFKARIFQKFSQADSSDTRQKGGTGLGLAISKELIERMGGQVGFESQPGQGASFYFELPT
jgi:PAS domain S-box-containing protein